MEAILERTTRKDQKVASDSVFYFESVKNKLKSSKKETVQIRIKETDEFITIPRKALFLLTTILANMAEGKSITLIPSASELSTQQAADLLNVSRPHLVKLLESGIIPFRKVGRHRRVMLKDIIKYGTNLEKEREDQLQFLSNQAQELNLGY